MASNEIWTNEKIELCLIQLLIENCCEIINLDRENIRKEKSEKPDFIVRDGTHTVGVEIIRALIKKSRSNIYVRATNTAMFQNNVQSNSYFVISSSSTLTTASTACLFISL